MQEGVDALGDAPGWIAHVLFFKVTAFNPHVAVVATGVGKRSVRGFVGHDLHVQVAFDQPHDREVPGVDHHRVQVGPPRSDLNSFISETVDRATAGSPKVRLAENGFPKVMQGSLVREHDDLQS